MRRLNLAIEQHSRLEARKSDHEALGELASLRKRAASAIGLWERKTRRRRIFNGQSKLQAAQSGACHQRLVISSSLAASNWSPAHPQTKLYSPISTRSLIRRLTTASTSNLMPWKILQLHFRSGLSLSLEGDQRTMLVGFCCITLALLMRLQPDAVVIVTTSNLWRCSTR